VGCYPITQPRYHHALVGKIAKGPTKKETGDCLFDPWGEFINEIAIDCNFALSLQLRHSRFEVSNSACQ
jgi:hypothetical protein